MTPKSTMIWMRRKITMRTIEEDVDYCPWMMLTLEDDVDDDEDDD